MIKVLKLSDDIAAELRHFNRPYLSPDRLSMGYIKEYGIKIGFIKTNFWGDDGRLCLGLMECKIKQMKASRAKVWTGPRTLQRDGNITQAIASRITKESKRITHHRYSKATEENKTSAKP